ncbi:uncharacterized protein JCM10292_005884 [Rhodotorula paludigena]|uniref:uncharacterized protein n=1 Tax=Rhodotorula paludigena TaxID=86838 RepID=UPI00317B60C6
MLVWALKLLVLSLNIRSSHKALRPTRPRSRAKGAPEPRGERIRRSEIRDAVVDWVVWGCFCVLEKLADRTVAWAVPLYGTVKALVLLTLLCWRGPGSRLIFDKAISPFVRPYERPLDLIGFVLSEVLDIALAALLFAPRWCVKKWIGRRREPDIPSIMRGLRQPQRPDLAHSLADSIERFQGDTDVISARLSQPVQLKLHPVPFRPQRPSRPAARPEAAAPVSAGQHITSIDFGPSDAVVPAASSSAPFRPVSVIPPPSISASGRQAARAQADTGPSTSRLPRVVAPAPPPAANGSTSFYPSLAGVSTPLPAVMPTFSSAPSLASSEEPPAPAPHPARSSAKKGKARASLDDESMDPGSPAAPSDSAPHGTKRKRASRRSSPLPPSPPAEPALLPSPARAAASPAHPPATPAPPGAFSFLSSQQSAKRPNQIPAGAFAGASVEDARMDLHGAVLDEAEATSRRRSGRQSAAHSAARSSFDTPKSSKKRTRRSAADTDAAEEGASVSAEATPKKRRGVAAESSPRGPLANVAKEDTVAGAGTPRQRALGAIAQLSKDLGQEDDELPLRKKAGRGVLGRSVLGKEPALARSTRAAKRGVGGDDEDYVEEEQAPTVSPRKRKVSRLASSSSARAFNPDDDASDSTQPPPAKRGSTAASRSRLARPTSTSTYRANSTASAPNSLTNSRSTHTLPAASASATALPRSRSRLAVSTSAASSRAPSPAPSTSAQDADELVVPARRANKTSTTADGAASFRAPPPARRARRVLLGRAGGAAPEEEEEIDGVPVVARKKSKR